MQVATWQIIFPYRTGLFSEKQSLKGWDWRLVQPSTGAHIGPRVTSNYCWTSQPVGITVNSVKYPLTDWGVYEQLGCLRLFMTQVNVQYKVSLCLSSFHMGLVGGRKKKKFKRQGQHQWLELFCLCFYNNKLYYNNIFKFFIIINL